VGELLGHIPLGIELVNKLWREICDEEEAASWESITPRTDDVRLHLLHLIASHHGTHEFGSPVLPKTPEAVLLHFVDNIDAKLEMLQETYDHSPLLGKNVFERRRPIYHSLVRPLPRFEDQLEEGDTLEATIAAEVVVTKPEVPENQGASMVGSEVIVGDS
jgi:3'-5' exoribonuclease